MRELPEGLDAALDACMEASLAPERWDDALDQLCGALGMVGAGLNTNGASVRLALPASRSYRDMLEEYVKGGWGAHDVRGRRGWPIVASGAVVVDDDMITTREERRRSPFYTEFLERHDMPVFAAFGFRIDDQLWSLSGARSARQGPASADERALMAAAQPHLKRIVRLASKVALNRRHGAMASLEAMGEAAVCVDFSGRVLQMTKPAEALVGDGMWVRAGRVAFADVQAESALHHLIRAALDPAAPYSSSAWGVSVQRADKRPLIAEVVPARNALCDPLGFAGALILLHDLDQPRVSDIPLLRQAFGLSRREAQVAAMIGAGADLEEIAMRLELRMSSVNQLIKAAMAKAQVGSRAELAALVVRLPRAKT